MDLDLALSLGLVPLTTDNTGRTDRSVPIRATRVTVVMLVQRTGVHFQK